MEIFFKTITGRTIAIIVQDSDGFCVIKEKIKDKEGFDVDEQKLSV